MIVSGQWPDFGNFLANLNGEFGQVAPLLKHHMTYPVKITTHDSTCRSLGFKKGLWISTHQKWSLQPQLTNLSTFDQPINF